MAARVLGVKRAFRVNREDTVLYVPACDGDEGVNNLWKTYEERLRNLSRKFLFGC